MRILVVDDEPASAGVLTALLAPFGRCVIADDGPAALEEVQAALRGGAPYDLVCLDILLGDMDGHDVLKQVREAEAARGIDEDHRARVVMTTVVNEPSSVMAAYYELCDAYLVKPITRQRLVDVLDRLGIEAQQGGA